MTEGSELLGWLHEAKGRVVLDDGILIGVPKEWAGKRFTGGGPMKNLTLKLLGVTALVGIFAGALAAFPGWMDPPSRGNAHDPRNHPHPKVPQIDPGIAGPTSTPTPVGCRIQPAQNALVQANNAFAVDLYGALANTLSPSDNLVYSPFSVSTALDMAWSGAAGQTASQMAAVLHLRDDPGVVGTQVKQLLGSLASSAANQLTFTVGDSLWLNSKIAFSPDYLAQMQQDYGAAAASLSFDDGPAVVDLINQWVANSTDQLIKKILAPTDVKPSSVAFLLNAILLEAGWQSQFLPNFNPPTTLHLRRRLGPRRRP